MSDDHNGLEVIEDQGIRRTIGCADRAWELALAAVQPFIGRELIISTGHRGARLNVLGTLKAVKAAAADNRVALAGNGAEALEFEIGPGAPLGDGPPRIADVVVTRGAFEGMVEAIDGSWVDLFFDAVTVMFMDREAAEAAD